MLIIYPVLGAVAATVLHAIFNEVFGNEKGAEKAVIAESKKGKEPVKMDKEPVSKDEVAAATSKEATSRKRSVSRTKK